MQKGNRVWEGIRLREGIRDGARALLDLLLPLGCGGCDAPGLTWCPDCAGQLGPPVRVHPPCCAHNPPVHALGAYRGRLRTALLAYKERGRRDLADPLGGALAAGLRGLPSGPGSGGGTGGGTGPASGVRRSSSWPDGLCLVPVPSRWSAAARRGGQHMALLADRAAAALAGAGVTAVVAPALRLSPGARDSVGLDLPARQDNLTGRVRWRPAARPPAGMPVVLVDDVVTTGATVAVCAATLRHQGVKVQSIVALAAVDRHFLL